MAFSNKKPSANSKPELANSFGVQALKNFGNENMDEAIGAVIDAARQSGNDKAIALADAFETGAVTTIDCDQVFGIASELPEGEARDGIMGQLSQIRKTMRWNAGFGARMREFKPEDLATRSAYGEALIANLTANGAIPSRITANNLAAQAPTLKIARATLAGLEKVGVQLDASSKTVVLSKAIAGGDAKAASKLLVGLQSEELDQRTAKMVASLEIKLDILLLTKAISAGDIVGSEKLLQKLKAAQLSKASKKIVNNLEAKLNASSVQAAE